MKLVDRILLLIDSDPAQYAEADKWGAVRAVFFNAEDPSFLLLTPGILPFLWLGLRKLKHKPITSRHVTWAVVLAILLALLGYFGPILLQGLLAWISFGGGFYISI